MSFNYPVVLIASEEGYVRYWVIVSVVILLLIGLQVVFTWIGCISPMIDMPEGISDQGTK
jgi:hypothetical protein